MQTVWEADTTSGRVECLEVFGDELTIVNCARVSFGVEHDTFTDQDARLVRYLVKHKHFSPFRHVFFRLRIRAPEFVMRQWYKHVVGSEWTSSSSSQLHGWNEISGRYVVMDDTFYEPKVWRKQSSNNKQGSDGVVEDAVSKECSSAVASCYEKVRQTYQFLLEKGISKEQARILLPLAVETRVIWTCSLQALLHFIDLRKDSHAQEEIREFALELDKMVRSRFPVTHDAFSTFV